MKDITTRSDIELLVDEFYEQVINDKTIGHFFTSVVKLDWDKHIPVMYDFWETTLLGNVVYKGNPMVRHIDLNRKALLLPQHFDTWLQLWEQTINRLFQGPKASEAISRAQQIVGIMKFKISDQNSTA